MFSPQHNGTPLGLKPLEAFTMTAIQGAAGLTGSNAVISTGNNANNTYVAGRRDKRRQTIASRIALITKTFEEERDSQYRDMLHTLQSTLSSLHTGKNADFQEHLTDIEELRDMELMRLNLWESYQIEQTEEEYQREIASANDEYNRMTQLVKERLMARLEAQRKKLREEKAYLDIANENNMFLSAASSNLSGYQSYPSAPGNNNTSMLNGAYGGTPASFYLSNAMAGYTSGGGTAGYASNGGDVSGGNNSPSLTMYGFPGERRSLRRRELMNASAFEEMSGLSASGGGPGAGGNISGGERGYGSSSTSKRRKGAAGRGIGASAVGGGASSVAGASSAAGAAGNASGDDFGLSDRDALEGILFSRERDLGNNQTHSGAQGRSSKSYQPPTSLKPEDAAGDLAELRTASTALKRKRANLE